MRGVFLLGTLLGLVIGLAAVEGARVTSINPTFGGAHGGTQVKIFGEDFSTNLQLSNEDPIHEAFFVSQYQSYICDLHREESDEKQLVCYTRAMPQGSYTLRLLEYTAVVPSNSHFTTWNDRTPVLSTLNFTSGEPGQLISVYGVLYTNIISSSVAEATNGNTAAFTRVVTSAGDVCNLYNEETNEPYGIHLNGPEGIYNDGSFTCLLEGSFVGYQNISFIIDGNYGQSYTVLTQRKISATNDIYMFLTYAVVTDVSPKEGSTAGGTVLTISGRHFYDNIHAIAKVMVGGKDCDVMSVTETEIKCKTPEEPATSQSMYSGGRGMVVEMFPGESDISASLDSSAEGTWNFFVDHMNPEEEFHNDTFISRSKGFFVPTVTANYQFAALADDQIQFFFNQNGPDPSGAVKIIDAGTDTTLGDPFALEAGSEYYFEIRHKDAGGARYFRVTVFIDKTDLTSQQSASIRAEEQTISITSTVSKEIQEITFVDWAEEVEATNSQWAVTFTCTDTINNCSGVPFFFALFGSETDPLNYGFSSPDEVATAFNSLVPLANDEVNATVADDGEYGFNITFNSTRGRMVPTGKSVEGSPLTVVLTEVVLGSPLLDTFTLEVNGYVSSPLPVDAPAEDVKDAVNSLFGAKCPNELEGGIGVAVAYYDMESSGAPSGSRRIGTSFCGSYSTRNPSYLFRSGDYIPFTDAPEVCFAYIGDIAGHLHVTYKYVHDNGEDFEEVEKSSNFAFDELVDSPDEWRHVCLNVYEAFQTAQPEGFLPQIKEISTGSGSDSATDLYVDNIFVGVSEVPQEDRERLVRQVLPSAVPHISLSSIGVVKDASTYTITFHPLSCGSNFPLLGFAFSNSKVEQSEDEVHYLFTDGTPQIHVTRTRKASPPVTGTFNISFTDPSYQTISGIPANANPKTLKNELESLKQIDDVDVGRGGSCYGYSWAVTFNLPGGDFASMVPEGSSLNSYPDPAVIAGATTAAGGLSINPITGDYIKTAHEKPQVQVYIDGILSHCEGSPDLNPSTACDFEWSASVTPTVTTVSPSSGPSGTAVTITGTGFSESESNNTVKVGNVECTVTAFSTTSITCTLGDPPSGQQSMAVEVYGKGFASGNPMFEVTGAVTSIDPSSGSANGCNTITIAGSGFESSTTVSIDGSVCSVVGNTTYDSISCVTSAGSVGSHTVVVTTAGVDILTSVQYTYATPSGSITSVSSVNVNIGENLTISGSGFGNEEGEVYIGEAATGLAEIFSWIDTEIEIQTPILPTGNYEVGIWVPGDGCASSSVSVSYSFAVTSISPQEGSLVGGTEVTLTGSGFRSDMSVKFGDVDCEVTSVSNDGTSSTCVTKTTGTHYVVRNTGRNPTVGIGYAWNPSTLDIIQGDIVTVGWSFPRFVSGNIGLQTTANASDDVYDENGFFVPQISSGNYTYVLNNAGTIYYNSGCLTNDCSLIMKGTLNVAEASDLTKTLSIAYKGTEANYPMGEIPFVFTTGNTAIVTNIGPRQGTTSTVITIEGTGFGTNPNVVIDGKMCAVSTSTDSYIECSVGADQELNIETYYEVKVKTSAGFARNEIRLIENRTFVLLPEVQSISPRSGSLQGGTHVTVQGSGFMPGTTVTIGSWLVCDVINDETFSYSTFVCVTRSHTTGDRTEDLQVKSGASTVSCDDCSYSHELSRTPIVTTFVHDSQWGNLEMIFEGSGFETTMADITVTLRSGDLSTQCVVSSVVDTTVVCIAPRFAVGPNEVILHVKGKGLAQFDPVTPTVTSPASLSTVEPTIGSLQGGTVLTLTGNGFVDGATSVTVGGVSCDIQTTDLTTVTCITGARDGDATVDVVIISNGQAYNHVSYQYSLASTPQVPSASPAEASSAATLTLSGSGFGTDASVVAVTVGGVDCSVTLVSDSEIQCTLGLREGGAAAIEVHVAGKGLANVEATFSYVFTADSVHPSSGSYAGSQSITVRGEGFSENTVVTICGNKCMVESHTTQDITCLTPANSNSSLDSTSCDIVVANGDNNVTMNNAYSYLLSLTPTIISVSPNRGGTGGGTRITITGTGFSATDSSVTIDGVVCDIISQSTTEILCETNSHQGSLQTKVAVSVGSNGIATQENADFYYIDRWSSIFTWGGTTVPGEGEFVIIQKGQTVLLDSDTEVLKMLLIDGGKFIFDEADVTLNAENILITNGGLLQVGTEDEPFQHKATIEMHGHLRSPELPIYGAKTLGVRNGTLELHGRPIVHPWTVLAETAEAGATEITLRHSVSDWQVGDQIVIASTGTHTSQRQNEQRTITAKSADSTTLTLDQALSYRHLGVSEEIGGEIIEFRAEIGLLTRNIVFRGSDNADWHDDVPACPAGFATGQFATQTCFQGRFGAESGSDEFGGAIMMHSKYQSSPDILARIEHVELTNVGQAFRLGRYPIHWHLMGNVSGMYVRNCAIHKSFNRAITIHGTHNLLVEGNIGYDIKGGAVFIEDGIETKNIIQYNLMVFVRQSTSLLNDDITPAAYWVTNPDNIIRHNHAAGGTHFGFWYRMHTHPDGPSYTPNVCQQKVELGEFFNNTVHSQGWYGLWIFKSYFPVVGGSCNSNVPSPAKFRRLITWNSNKGAEYVQCGAIQLIDCIVVDNAGAGMDLQVGHTGYLDLERGSAVINSLIIGHSSYGSGETGVGLIFPFGSGFMTIGTKFVNFNRGGQALGGAFLEGLCRSQCGGLTYRFSNISFENVSKRMGFRWIHEAVLIDLDGTLLDSEPGSSLVPYTSIMDPNKCVVQPGSLYSSNVQAAICAPSYRMHRVGLNNIQNTVGESSLRWVNEHGNATSPFVRNKVTHDLGYLALIPTGESYVIYWGGHQTFVNISFSASFYNFLEGDKIFIGLDFKKDPDRIFINGRGYSAPENSTELTSSNHNGDWSYDTYSNRLTVQLSHDSTSRKKRYALNDPLYQHPSLNLNVFKCFFEYCEPGSDPDITPPSEDRPSEFSLWSNTSNECVEWVTNDTVVIKEKTIDDIPCWVVVDVNNITVKNLTVVGTLHFEDHDCTVEATYIVVLGRLLTQSSGISYFNKKLTFNLKSEPDDEESRFLAINLGTKAIGCFGGCEFRGIPHELYWTHLDETVYPGATTIKLREQVHTWSVGDEIVITTTGYHASETEKNVIESIDADNQTITLQSPLVYRHLGESYTAGDMGYDMRAEVGLLTRNIKIRGVNHTTIETDGHGGRVVVASISLTNRGWAHFSNVEFFRTGQEGFVGAIDPRFSLAYVNTGSPSAARPSIVHGCAFHDGYATAIGTFGASKLTISENIIHRTVGSGVTITGSGHSLLHNLVTVTLYAGSWAGRYDKSELWVASFDLSSASDPTVIGNTAAGSERAGFRTIGEKCDGPNGAFRDNTVHGCLHGVHALPTDGASGCSVFSNFLVYKAYDFGIYHNTEASPIVTNTIVVDSNVAYFSLVFGPPSTTHVYAHKFARYQNITCVGRSDHYDPQYDVFDTTHDKNAKLSRKVAGPKSPTGGKICILIPLFTSDIQGAPNKFFHRIKKYPALYGLLNITDITVHNYKLRSDRTRDLVFYTNPMNDDMCHPTHVSGVKMTEVEENSKVFYDRPNPGLINPADCVDMECDAKKKVMVKDLDGSFLGAVGAIIPQAEYGWDDPRRPGLGLGDYRIPKTMLTDINGRRIPVEEIIDQRGIIRNGACTYKPGWQAYDCHGPYAPDHQMLVIESLDGDTETRRLSPVALLGNRTIDLNNGPQDHGWCFGYTCQKRISTFWTLVASGHHFDIFFTSYAPRRLRLHFLNVDDSTTVRVAIWYARPERMDVYRTESDLFIHPENSQYYPEGDYWGLSPITAENLESYKPPLDSQVHGANFMDLDTRLLYVTLRGNKPLDIVTVPAIYVSYGLPVVAVTDFFEKNLVSNLANFLRVPASKIRYVKIVRETNARKRRDTSSVETVTYTLMYSDELTNSTFDPADEPTAIEVINNGAAALIIAYQNETMADILGVNITSFSATYISTNVDEEVNPSYLVTYEIPRSLTVTTFPSSVEEYLVFPNQPMVTMLDENGNRVATLDDVFELTVTLDTSVANANPLAELRGTTNMMFSNGSITFTDLMITHFGTYNLMFEIISPAGITLEASIPVEVRQRSVQAVFVGGVNQLLEHNSTIDVTVELQNSAGMTLPDVGFKGHSWKMDVSLDDAKIYNDSVSFGSNTTFDFDPATARATTTGLMLLNTETNLRYNLMFTIYTEPELHSMQILAKPIKYTSIDASYNFPTTKTLVLEVSGIPYVTRNAENNKAKFETYIHNEMAKAVDPDAAQLATFSSATTTSGDTSVTAVVNAANEDAATAAIETLKALFENRLTYNGNTLTLSTNNCGVMVDGVCQDEVPSETVISDPGGFTGPGQDSWLYIGIGVGAAVVIAAVIITAACLAKRSNSNKVGEETHARGCLDAASSRGTSPSFGGSFLTDSTDLNTRFNMDISTGRTPVSMT